MNLSKSRAQTVEVKKGTSAALSKSEGHASDEQRIYANILDIGMKIGLAGIIMSFVVYVANLMPARIPVNEVSNYWGLKSHDYLELTSIKGGWSWVSLYNYSDFLNFFPIAFLAGISIFCYLAIIPTLLRKKDTVYAILALLEVLVLAGAASGLIAGGGH